MSIATEILPSSGSFTASAAELVALPVCSGPQGPEVETTASGMSPEELRTRLPAALPALVEHYGLTGKAGEVVQLPVDLGGGLVRLALFGVGAASASDLRTAGAALARAAKGRSRAAVALPAESGSPAQDPGVAAFAEGALLASYTFSLASSPSGPEPVATIELLTSDLRGAGDSVRRGVALAHATARARDLINTPSNEKGPAWLAEQAQRVGGETGLEVSVRGERELEAEGFGAILAVGRGAERPPRLVQLSYEPADPVSHVVLVGKGITFDTGGLSLKPNDNMKLMKTDMTGSAVVLGVMSALAELGARVRVTALLAVAENALSGSAMRPSDVLTTYNGRTVEVLNTDAEGRLVMADALAYADTALAPDTVVDVATLTGAAKLALGTGTGALFSTDDTLAAGLEEAALRSDEPVWRMPLVEEYRDTLRSRVADLANIGTSSDYGSPGATDAAMFLREFTGGRQWAHLDIAGPGRSSSDEGVVTKGGTGFATRSLLRWLAG